VQGANAEPGTLWSNPALCTMHHEPRRGLTLSSRAGYNYPSWRSRPCSVGPAPHRPRVVDARVSCRRQL